MADSRRWVESPGIARRVIEILEGDPTPLSASEAAARLELSSRAVATALSEACRLGELETIEGERTLTAGRPGRKYRLPARTYSDAGAALASVWR